MHAWLFALFAMALMLYTDDYVIAGVLPELANDLDVADGQAGLLVAAIAAASTTPALFTFAARHASAGKTGRYIAIVSLGVTGSIPAGVPMGTWIGGVFGWQAALAAKILAGALVLLTYLAPYLAAATTAGGAERALAFSLSGIAGVGGIRLGGNATDRWGRRPYAAVRHRRHRLRDGGSLGIPGRLPCTIAARTRCGDDLGRDGILELPGDSGPPARACWIRRRASAGTQHLPHLPRRLHGSRDRRCCLIRVRDSCTSAHRRRVRARSARPARPRMPSEPGRAGGSTP